MACCLHYLKDTGYVWMTANTFGLHQSNFSKLIVKVCQTITYSLGPELEHLPSENEQMKKKTTEVKIKFGMLQDFAFINRTHIPILKTTESSKGFFNYEGFHSITMQSIMYRHVSGHCLLLV